MYKVFLFLLVLFAACTSSQIPIHKIDLFSAEYEQSQLSADNLKVLNRIVYFAKQDAEAGNTAVVVANGNCKDKQHGVAKTLTSQLLEKFTGRDVYRIDLSQVVNKYIGETEKNLKSVFENAKRRKFILWFDEADALFGKRTGVKQANDRYQNVDVQYILQSIEAYKPLVVLFSNYKARPDKATKARFDLWIDLDCDLE